MEKQVIQKAFHFYKGNKTSTATSLGIAIRTLENKLDKYEADAKAHLQRVDDAKREREAFSRRERGIPAGAQFDNSATPSRFDPRGKTEMPAIGLGTATEINEDNSTEPTQIHSAQQPMPLSERKEVQGVLSRAASQSGARKTR